MALIFFLFLAWFVGGYYHAQRRMKKGLPPLAYHRVRLMYFFICKEDHAKSISGSFHVLNAHVSNHIWCNRRTSSHSIKLTTGTAIATGCMLFLLQVSRMPSPLLFLLLTMKLTTLITFRHRHINHLLVPRRSTLYNPVTVRLHHLEIRRICLSRTKGLQIPQRKRSHTR